jgi:hypothetical protein
LHPRLNTSFHRRKMNTFNTATGKQLVSMCTAKMFISIRLFFEPSHCFGSDLLKCTTQTALKIIRVCFGSLEPQFLQTFGAYQTSAEATTIFSSTPPTPPKGGRNRRIDINVNYHPPTPQGGTTKNYSLRPAGAKSYPLKKKRGLAEVKN